MLNDELYSFIATTVPQGWHIQYTQTIESNLVGIYGTPFEGIQALLPKIRYANGKTAKIGLPDDALFFTFAYDSVTRILQFFIKDQLQLTRSCDDLKDGIQSVTQELLDQWSEKNYPVTSPWLVWGVSEDEWYSAYHRCELCGMPMDNKQWICPECHCCDHCCEGNHITEPV